MGLRTYPQTPLEGCVTPLAPRYKVREGDPWRIGNTSKQVRKGKSYPFQTLDRIDGDLKRWTGAEKKMPIIWQVKQFLQV